MKRMIARPLYVNSFWLLVAFGANQVLGFVFWVITARLYPPNEVGRATAMQASGMMLSTVASLGLGTGLIRFIPMAGDGAAAMVNQALTFSGLTTALLTGAFILGLQVWSPELAFLQRDPAEWGVFLSFSLGSALFLLSSQVSIALQRSGNAAAMNLSYGALRTVLSVALAASSTSVAIIGAWSVASILTTVGSLLVMVPRTLRGYRALPHWGFLGLRPLASFSIANFAADTFWSMPFWLMPQIMLNLLGPEQNAYFSIAWGVGLLPHAAPIALTVALFAEGSNRPDQVGANLRRTLLLCAGVLVPGIAVLMLLRSPLLHLYGPEYAVAGEDLLGVTALSALPLTVTLAAISVARVERQLRRVVVLSGVAAVVTFVVAVPLTATLGIVAGGVGLLAAHTLVALCLLPSIVMRVRRGT